MKTKLFIKGEQKGVIDETNRMIVGAVGSSGIIDRHGESINPEGWVLDNYVKNPVVLFAHDYRSLPVGKADKVWFEDGKLLFNIKFADTQMGNEVFSLFKDGFLNAFSVGLIPEEWGTSGKDAYTIMKQELLELSVVPIPANPEALGKDEQVQARFKSIENIFQKELFQTDYRILCDAIKQVFKEVLADELSKYKIVEEKIIEKKIEVEKNRQSNDFLLQLRDTLRSTDKEVGLALRKLNLQLQIKSSQTNGGDNHG